MKRKLIKGHWRIKKNGLRFRVKGHYRGNYRIKGAVK